VTSVPQRAAQLAEQIQKQAARVADPRLRRLLLAVGCDFVDAAMQLHRPPEAA
jgi:hypothetical protein